MTLDDRLVGAQLEVCWGTYKATADVVYEDGADPDVKEGDNVKMWCPCKVVRVADGQTDKGRDAQPFSNRAIKLAPRGMVLVEWEPDPGRGETDPTLMWLLLDPRPPKWNGDAHRAWRFHPEELKRGVERFYEQPRGCDAC